MAQAILMYFVIIPDYGFNLTSTQEVANARSNKAGVDKVVSYTINAKILLLVISFFTLVVLIEVIPFLNQNKSLFYSGFLIVVGQTFFPMWFFQGIEKLQFVAYLNFIARIILTALIFLIVDSKEDYLWILPIYSAGPIIASIIALFLMARLFHVSFLAPTWLDIKSSLFRGFNLFVGSLANNTSVNAGIIILGAFSTPQALGQFAIVDKVLVIFRQMFTVFGQAVYPTLCRVRMQEEVSIKKIIQDLFKLGIPVIFTGCLILFVWPDYLLIVLMGQSDEEVILLLRIVLLIPLFLFTSTLISQVLLAYQYRRYNAISYILVSIIGIVINFLFISSYHQIGAAVSVVIIEFVLLLVMAFFYFKSDLNHLLRSNDEIK